MNNSIEDDMLASLPTQELQNNIIGSRIVLQAIRNWDIYTNI